MKLLYKILLLILFIPGCCPDNPRDIVFTNNEKITVNISTDADYLIQWAASDLADDFEKILDRAPEVNKTNSVKSGKKTDIYIACYNDSLYKELPFNLDDDLKGKWEKYIIKQHKCKVYIIGSDLRGTVYGVFELANRMGVSPWKWWADVVPEKQERIKIDLPERGIISSPSVQYRGIFLNDEDWGLQPWAAKTFEPETGDIGPKTYEKVFQLLLRLKANTIWPAMHHCTKAFFSVPGNKEMAEKYHIAISTSHCEPMLCNNVYEWDVKKNGSFNYFTNSKNVKKYWNKRIENTKDGNNFITLGMRGIHDDEMEGDASTEEKVEIMEQIITDQREILEKTLKKPADSIPQLLIPYKEVLDLYNNGLKVPDDVTLMWTDDNYGYIRRLSDEEEQKRSGGSGVYYHISYWGRPHDYLWLSTTQPGLIWYEMKRAYENDARKIWILNVGDIKPNEYDMEFFLDMAWNVYSINQKTIYNHLENWSQREFGQRSYKQIAKVLDEYYRLAMLRKPEYMGWSRTEPKTPVFKTEFNSSANNNEVIRRIQNYKELAQSVQQIKKHIPEANSDAFFQLVEYPVKGAAFMNYKFLYSQLANETCDTNQQKKYYNLALEAFDSIKSLTNIYNNSISNGKWKEMMDFQPRKLAVFDMPPLHPQLTADSDSTNNTDKTKKHTIEPIFIQAYEYNTSYAPKGFYWYSVDGLGYSNKSLTVFPLKNVTFDKVLPWTEYQFHVKEAGEYIIEVRFLPTHANNFDYKAILQINKSDTVEFNLNTKGRSPEWKTNVLRNFKAVYLPVTFEETGYQTLKIFVNQTGIVIDQIAINPKDYPPYYEIPK